MKFWLGTMSSRWLETSPVPLFLNRRVMPKKKPLRAAVDWALDSGGYSELNGSGAWSVTTAQYADEILRWSEEVGRLQWAAPMDWMCEPSVREKTGLSVYEHQLRTIDNFLDLRERVGPLVIPVLQGWEPEDYDQCVALYSLFGVNLAREPVVGLGSVCRRGVDIHIGRIIRQIATYGIRMHAFGVRGKTLVAHSEVLESADSMAWSYRARAARQPGPNAQYEITGKWCCGAGKNCAGCMAYALRWRRRLLGFLDQLQLPLCDTARAKHERLEVVA